MRRSGIPLAALLALLAALCWLFLQEPGVGRIEGTLLREDGKPLPRTTIFLNGSAGTLRVRTDRNGHFFLRRIPVGTYRVTSGAEHHRGELEVSIAEAQTSTATLKLVRSQPALNIAYSRQRVYTSKEAPRLPVDGFADRPTLTVTVWRARLSQALRTADGAEALEELDRTYDGPKTNLPVALQTLRSKPLAERTEPVERADREGFFTRRLTLPVPAGQTGLYLVRVASGAAKLFSYVVVTDMALVVKEPPRDARSLVYAVDQNTGVPLAGARIERLRDGITVGERAVTGRDGLAWLDPLPQIRREVREVIIAQRGADEAVLTAALYGEREGAGRAAMHLHTDRPIYRPGHTIRYKAIVRRRTDPDDPNKMAVPAGAQATVIVRDSGGLELARTSYTLSRAGTLSGEVATSAEGPTGYYTIETLFDGEKHSQSVPILSYRKPEFEVTATPDKPRALLGETVQWTIDGHYYFGGPLAGAKVRYSLYREIDWAAEYADAEIYDELDESERSSLGYWRGYYGEPVAEGEAELDANGRAVIPFVAQTPPKEKTEEGDGEGSTHPGEEPQAQTFTCNVTVTDRSGRTADTQGEVRATSAEWTVAVAADGSVGQPKMVTTVFETVRDAAGKPVPDAPVSLTLRRARWDKKEEAWRYEPVGAPQEERTGPDGRAILRVIPPRSGEYDLLALVKSPSGRETRSHGSLWVAADRDTDLETEYEDLTLLTDRLRYQPGQTARLLINAARTGQSALLTIESDRVHAAYVIPLKQRSTVFRLPIEARFGPNVSLTACYVRDKKLARSEATLRVAAPRRELTIRVTPTPAKAQPGEEVSCAVNIRDAAGRPVRTDFSLAVADEALFALERDNPRSLREDFYPARAREVETRHSFAIEYLGGDEKGEPNIQARRTFLDTAYWNPSLTTGPDGNAQVRFKLPDNLTAWRLTARACTDDTKIGYASAKLTASKPFMIRLEAPRFVAEGDRTRLRALIHNDTGKSRKVSVRLTAAGLIPEDQETRSLSVESGAIGQLDWPLEAGRPADIPLRLTAWTDDRAFTDGLVTTLAVRPFGREALWTRAGLLQGAGQSIEIPLAADAVPGESRLTVRVTPGIGGPLAAALEYLSGYPYGCTEQTLSRFVPELIAYRVDRGLLTESQRATLPRRVADGLARLARLQHESGAWGWWEYDEDSTFLSAYALCGLAEAKAGGWPVPQGMIDNCVKALKQRLAKAPEPFALYALARAGKPVAAPLPAPGAQTTGDLAWTILYRRQIALDTGPYRAELVRRARREGPLASWSVREQGALWWDTSDRMNTSVAVRALLALDPNDPLALEGIRWLVTQREGDDFGDTRDTSWTLAALCDYLRVHPEARTAPGAIAVSLNGTAIPLVGDDRERVARIPSRLLKTGINGLALSRNGGEGAAFWTAELRYLQAPEKENGLAPRTPDNITLGRDYTRLDDAKQQPETSFQQGEGVAVRLTIQSPRDLEYVLVEDAFPSGFEPTERGTAETEYTGQWTEPYSYLDVRDDRVAFFFRRLKAGKHTIVYHLRAQTPGTFRILPSLLTPMYRPTLRVESRDSRVEVRS